MSEYHKIDSIYKRDEQTGRFILGAFSRPEFEYLQHNKWEFTEKVDGTNIRVYWSKKPVPNRLFRGRSDKASIPTTLCDRLDTLFPETLLEDVFGETDVCLYGEGYGARIQKGGGNYNPTGVDFVLFDVKIGSWWLQRGDVNDIAAQLGIKSVPVIGTGTLHDAIAVVTDQDAPLTSQWGAFMAEGLVLRPTVALFNRKGERIITKVKVRDFK